MSSLFHLEYKCIPIERLFVWTAGFNNTTNPHVGEMLNMSKKDCSSCYNECIVGYLPYVVYKVAWYFLQHGGEILCI